MKKAILVVHPEANINNNPNLSGIVEILSESGFSIHYACRERPGISVPTYPYVEKVWFLEELDIIDCSSRFDLVIGIDDGIIGAAAMARSAGIPYGLISYEIFFADEIGMEAKRPVIEACEGIDFAVCQDPVRARFLSLENGIPYEKIFHLPVAGRGIRKISRNLELHQRLGLDPKKRIALYIGSTEARWALVDDLAGSTDHWPEEWDLVLHNRYNNLYSAKSFTDKYKNFSKVHFTNLAPLDFDSLASLIASCDVGLAFYRPTFTCKYTGKNLQYLGMSSGKISTYLQCGKPVLCNSIGIYSDLLKEHGAGVVLDDIREVGASLSHISQWDVQQTSRECHAFFERHLDLDKTISPLVDKVRECLQPRVTAKKTVGEKISKDNFGDFSVSRKVHWSLLKRYEKEIYNRSIDPENCDLKCYQDLLAYAFIVENIPTGGRLLEVGGGDSRILRALANSYECWNVDKLEGRGDGPRKRKENLPYRLVQDYLGNFNPELPEDFFDCVFSISALEHSPEKEDVRRDILADIDRVLKPSGYSLHCLDTVIPVAEGKKSWCNGLLPYIYDSIDCIGEFVPPEKLKEVPGLYGMGKEFYDKSWRKILHKTYEEFGMPLSCNVLWQKPIQDSAAKESDSFLEDLPSYKVSAIVSVYNCREYIQGCLDDLIAQSLYEKGALEIVIVDTGSEQNEGEIIAEYLKRFSHVVYIRVPERETVYSAWNRAIVEARGEYLTSASSDDRHHPEALEQMAAQLDQAGENVGLVYCDSLVHNVKNQPWSDHLQVIHPTTYPEYCRKKFLESWFMGPNPVWRASLHREWGFFDPKYRGAGDWEFFLRVTQQYDLQKFSGGRVGLWYRDDVGQSNLGYASRDEWHDFIETYREAARKAEVIRRQTPAALSDEYLKWKKLNARATVLRSNTKHTPEPLVSAIVSAYKSAEMLCGCLQSLLDQTLGDLLEIIVIDSGSPQDEGAVVRHYQKNNPQIRYIRTEERETIYKAWNRGARAARGRYCVNTNTDDRLAPQALERMASFLEGDPAAGVVYIDQVLTNHANETWENHHENGQLLRHEGFPEILVRRNPCGPQVMWRRELHARIGWFKDHYEVAGDWDFWCRVAFETSFKVRHLAEKLGLYYFNLQGLEHGGRKQAERQREIAEIRCRYNDIYQNPRCLLLVEHTGNDDELGSFTKALKTNTPEELYRCVLMNRTGRELPSDLIPSQAFVIEVPQGEDSGPILEKNGVERNSWEACLTTRQIVTRKWLEQVIKAAEENPQCSVIFPRTIVLGEEGRFEEDLGAVQFISPNASAEESIPPGSLFVEESVVLTIPKKRAEAVDLNNLLLGPLNRHEIVTAGFSPLDEEGKKLWLKGNSMGTTEQTDLPKPQLLSLPGGGYAVHVPKQGEDRRMVLLATSAAPDQTPFSTTEKRPPVGFGYLISVLRQAGHGVVFIDNYLQPTCFLETDILETFEIDWVGIYTNTICFRDTQKMLYRLEEKRQRNRWKGNIMVGGPHVAVAPDTIPEFVDHLVIGEGEDAILDIVDGKVSERTVRYSRIKNLDRLPSPSWDFFSSLPYNWGGNWLPEGPVFTMNTSRGCPFRCTFCSVCAVWGKDYTFFSAERIVAEIECLVRDYGAKGIYFREDNFTLNRERLEKFCRLMLEKGIAIPWVCETRANTLDRDTVALMAQAGARGFYIGVESGSQRLLDFMKKDLRVDQIRNAFALCREFGIKSAASIIVGVPTETRDDLRQTDSLLQEIQPTVTWTNVFVGIPDSPLYQYTLENRLHEFIDDRGLVYLKGHSERVRHFYGGAWNADLPIIIENGRIRDPRVSVIMSVHNGGKPLRKAIKSILGQSQPNFEFIIIDDGSTDGTASYLKKLQDPRLVVLANKKNIGLTKSLNIALSKARGTFIARMDADDVSVPHRLEIQLQFLEQHPDHSLVGSSFYLIDDGDRTTGIVNVLTDSAALKEGLKKQNWFGHGSVMMRRSALEIVGGYDEKFIYSQDYDLFLRLSEKFEVANLPEPLYFWRKARLGISQKKSREQQEYADMARKEALARQKRNETEEGGKHQNISPLVSVIVPTFNRPEMLSETLKSILAQSYRNFEIIVVNDAGISVEEIITSLNGDGRITYVRHARNRGLAAARNTGIRAAQGKYIAYLDDDDIFYSDHLETLVDYLENSPYQVAYTDAFRAHQELQGDQHVVVGRDLPYSHDFDCDRILYQNFIPVLCFMHERTCLEEVGMFDEELMRHEDWDLWVRLSRVFECRHIKKTTCEFRSRSDGSSMTSGAIGEFRLTCEKIFEKYKEYSEEKPAVLTEQKKMRLHYRNQEALELCESGRFEEALKLIEENFLIDRGDSRTWEVLAVAYIKKNNLPKGLHAFEEALRLDPGNAVIEQNIEKVREEIAKGDKITQAPQKILSAPEDVDLTGDRSAIREGERLFASGDFDGATRCFLASLNLNPADFEALNNMGVVIFADGRPEEALDYVERALRINAHFVQALENRQAILKVLDRDEEAIEAGKNLEAIRDYFAKHIQMGEEIFEAGEMEKAKQIFLSVLAFDPPNVDALNNLGVIAFHEGKPEKARVLWERCLEISPHFSDAQENLSGIVFRPDESFDKARSVMPFFSERVKEGERRFALGDLEGASLAFRQALDEDHGNIEALNNLGVLAYEVGKVEDALLFIEQALKFNNNFLQALENKARCLIALDDAEEATLWKKQADAVRSDVAKLIALGEESFAEGDIGKARQAFNSVLAFDPANIDALNNLGVLAANGGEVQEACILFQRCLAIDPAFPEASQNLECLESSESVKLHEESLEKKSAVNHRFSVITCSIDDHRFDQFKVSLENSFGEDCELIRVDDAHSLTEGYNRGVDRASGEFLIFCHDDVEFLTEGFGQILAEDLARFDIIGVAGTSRLVGGGWVQAGQPYLHGQVAHRLDASQENYHLCHYGLGRDPAIVSNVQALDGLFFAVRREVFEMVSFDEKTFDGFHLYDMDFTFGAFLQGFRLAIDTRIHLLHHSGGHFDQIWEHYAERFMKKYHGQLSPAPQPAKNYFKSLDFECERKLRREMAIGMQGRWLPVRAGNHSLGKFRVEELGAAEEISLDPKKPFRLPMAEGSGLFFQGKSTLQQLFDPIDIQREIARVCRQGAMFELKLTSHADASPWQTHEIFSLDSQKMEHCEDIHKTINPPLTWLRHLSAVTSAEGESGFHAAFQVVKLTKPSEARENRQQATLQSAG